MRPAWRSGHRRAPLVLAYLLAQTSLSLLRRLGLGSGGHDKLEYAPGQKGTVVFAAFAYGEKRPGPISKVTVATDVDFGSGVEATKVPTSATP